MRLDASISEHEKGEPLETQSTKARAHIASSANFRVDDKSIR